MAKETFTRLKPNLQPRTPSSTNIGTLYMETNGTTMTDCSFSFTGGDQAGFIFIVHASAPVGPGKMSASKTKLKRIHTVENVGLLNVLPFETQYLDRFGNAPEGSKVFIRLVVVDSSNGALTELFFDAVIVVAS